MKPTGCERALIGRYDAWSYLCISIQTIHYMFFSPMLMAVSCLSPVRIQILMSAFMRVSIVSGTLSWSLSSMAVAPNNCRFCREKVKNNYINNINKHQMLPWCVQIFKQMELDEKTLNNINPQIWQPGIIYHTMFVHLTRGGLAPWLSLLFLFSISVIRWSLCSLPLSPMVCLVWV